MKDHEKSKEQLFSELKELKQQIAKLEKSEAEHKQTEEALRQSEERYRTMIEYANDMIWTLDIQGRFTFYNHQAETISGRQLKDWSKKSFAPLIHPDDIKIVNKVFRKTLSGEPQHYTVRVYKKNGDIIILSVNTAPIYENGKVAGTVSFGRNITKRIQAEQALRESEEKYRKITELSPDGIAIEVDNKIVFVNTAGARILGAENPEQLIGTSVTDIVHPDYHQIVKKLMFQLKEEEKEVSLYEQKYIRLDGTVVDVEVGAGFVTYMGKLATQVFVRDISKRKQAEEALIQKTIELQERNEDLDSFAHTVAHDLKNPLMPIKSFADVLNENYSGFSDDKIRKYISIIAQSCGKMNHIINDLLLLSSLRKTEIQTDILNMSDIIEKAINSLSQKIEKNNVEIVFPDTWPEAFGYAFWVEEVWSNYINNAIKYGGTPPRVEIGADTEKSKNVPEGFVSFWVRDNGSGISPENQKLLFKKFERLNQVQTKGYGLGLSIVRRIIEKLGGQVGVESEPGKGSAFYFTLPAEENR